jgi:WD40 repeat protein
VLTGDTNIQAATIWDVSDTGGAEWANVPGVPGVWNSVAFSSDGDVLASAPGGAVRIWDAETGRSVRNLPGDGHPDESTIDEDIEQSPDGALVAAIVSGDIEVWDLDGGTKVFTFRAGDYALDLSWSPDGRVLAAASPGSGGTVIVNRAGRRVGFLSDGSGLGPSAVAFSPDGRMLATAVSSNTRPDPSSERVRIWDWRKGELLRTIHTRAQAVAFSPDGDRIAVAGTGGGEILSATSGEVVTEFAGGSEGLNDIAFSPDGSRVAAGGADGTVRLWDADSGVRTLVLDHGEPVTDVAFSPDGRKLASVSGVGLVRVWALDLDDLVRIARGKLTRGLTAEECRQFLHRDCPA